MIHTRGTSLLSLIPKVNGEISLLKISVLLRDACIRKGHGARFLQGTPNI